MVRTAWSSASTFRSSDNRGGANGSRIRLSPQKDWEVNNPKELAKVLSKYEIIATNHNTSIADVIIIAAAVAIEKKLAVIKLKLLPDEVMLLKTLI